VKAELKEKEREKTQPEAPPTLGERAKREALAWLWIILIFLFIYGVVGQARVIPSSSMEPTLLVGDHLIMDRLGYDAGVPFTNWHVSLWRMPKRQQIIILRPPYGGADLIKRVIGMPGDTLEIHDGSVWINNVRLLEPYIKEPMNPYDTFGPVNIPDGNYFVMGDNRADSYDSRYWGTVPRANVIGTPMLIYLSINDPPAPGMTQTQAWEPGHLVERFEAYGGALIHPSRIRWKRFFKTF
jgi:signal peptidase I